MLPRLSNPTSPWQTQEVEYLDEIPEARVEIYEDASRTILSENDPQRVGFIYGLNPYRGCQHACAYCEARRRHELLGFGAGTDFDTKLVVKTRAPELLRAAFDAPSWRGDVIVFSGSTDAYQPIEATYRLTRRCLEVCADYQNPVAIITKGALIERDIDLLQRLRADARVTVSVSIPIWDPVAARALEPWVPTPLRRMRTIARLADAGIDVGVSLAPVIGGLSDEEVPAILTAAYKSGARRAVMSFLRLPSPVDQVFAERVERTMPLRANRILARFREIQDANGMLVRKRGTHGVFERAVISLFEATCRRLGYVHYDATSDRINTPDAGPMETRTFRPPAGAGSQMKLF